jgi:hypothetical protein
VFSKIFYYLPTLKVKNILNNIEININMLMVLTYELFCKNIRIIISENGVVNITNNE